MWLTELRDSLGGPCWHGCSQPPRRLCPQVPISFKDLAVRFSEEEWRLLQEGQREFYRDVMRENYETLVSVGEGPRPPECGLQGQKRVAVKEARVPAQGS